MPRGGSSSPPWYKATYQREKSRVTLQNYGPWDTDTQIQPPTSAPAHLSSTEQTHASMHVVEAIDTVFSRRLAAGSVEHVRWRALLLPARLREGAEHNNANTHQ